MPPPSRSQRTLALWHRVPLTARILFAVLSGLMSILGIPGIADQVTDWCSLIAFVGGAVGQYVIPTIGVALLVALLGLQAGELQARRTKEQKADHPPKPEVDKPRESESRPVGPSLVDLAAAEVRKANALITRLLELERQGRRLPGGLVVDSHAWQADVVHALRSAARDDLVERFNRTDWLGALLPADIGKRELEVKLDRLGQIISELQAAGRPQPPVSPPKDQRRMLADESEQLAARLRAPCARWDPVILSAGQGPGSESERSRRAAQAGGEAVADYHGQYSVRAERVVEGLVNAGVLPDLPRRALASSPRFFDDVGALAWWLREASRRLRVHDLELARWLDERRREVLGLRDELLAEIERGPVPHMQTVCTLQERFDAMNTEVKRRLGTQAHGWLSYYVSDPDWWTSAGVAHITREQLQEDVRYWEYTADQLGLIRDQVATNS